MAISITPGTGQNRPRPSIVRIMCLATSSIPQMAVAHFLEQGGYDRYLRSARQHYRESTERMRTAVARAFPEGTAVSRPQGGFVLWVQLPDGVSGTEVYHRARAEDINVAPGLMFSTADKYENCLRLNSAPRRFITRARYRSIVLTLTSNCSAISRLV